MEPKRAASAGTEHLREELLRDEKHVILDAVLQHEQPVGEPLLDRTDGSRV